MQQGVKTTLFEPGGMCFLQFFVAREMFVTVPVESW